MGNWAFLADTDDRRAVIAKVRYGLGQITCLAFSFDDASFRGWDGREQFLQNMLKNLAPTAPDDIGDQNGFIGGRPDMPNDLSTDLIAQLDNFDVTIIPFGYVALFIVLYI